MREASLNPELDPKVAAEPGRAFDDGDSYTEAIASRLRDWIIEGRLAPGEPIRQAAVAAELGSSRLPVREALRLLEAEGLVSIQQHRGARVATLDLDECNEIYLMREALEPMALTISAPALTDEQLAHLRELTEKMETAGPRGLLEHDRQFHLLTYAGAGMPRLQRAIESLWTSTHTYRSALLHLMSAEALQRVHEIHRLVLYACERRDGVDAAQLMASHIRLGRVRLAQHPEIFGTPGPARRDVSLASVRRPELDSGGTQTGP